MTVVPILKSEADKTFAAVGEALSVWATVEVGLTIIFYTVGEVATRQKAAAIMDTIISFETRLAVVDALFKCTAMSELDQEIWRKVSSKLSSAYKKRHRIAHFRLLVSQSKDGIATAEVAPFFTYEKWITENQITLTRTQINELSEKFDSLHRSLLWIMTRIAVAEKPKEYFAQDHEEPNLITQIRQLAVQSLEERKLPRRS